MQIEHMPIVRIFFSKTGRAKYTSHLDTMRMLTRAFKRSGLPVWYTQGFNPHIYMTFALPIALGYESLCESVDIRLESEIPLSKVTEKLNKALPPGFTAAKAAIPVSSPKEIMFADYKVDLIYGNAPVERMKNKLTTFLDQPLIEVVKKTKKGEKNIDIKPLSEVLGIEMNENSLILTLRMPAGIELNINPTLFLNAFYSWSGIEPDGVRIIRTAILDSRKQDFS